MSINKQSDKVREVVSKVLKVNRGDLGCFTVMDHEEDKMRIVVHGGLHIGQYIEGPYGHFYRA